MDASSLVKNPKREKVYSDKDRISRLHESLLQHLLSYLPTKQAVRTSVLSRSWENVWESTPNLDFDDGMESATRRLVSRKIKRFFSFVDRVFSVNNTFNIHRFSIKSREYDAPRLDKWISDVTKRKVEEIIVSIRVPNRPYMFPSCIFMCDSLRMLKILMDTSVNIPATVFYSNLKVLHLSTIRLCGNQTTQVLTIVCPLLEELVLHYCLWVEITKVHILVPKLRTLLIADHFRWSLYDCEIKIEAENLFWVSLCSTPLYQYTFCNLSSVIGVLLEVARYVITPDDRLLGRLGTLLTDVRNVKVMRLHTDSILTLSSPYLANNMRAFSKLSHLKIVQGERVGGKLLIDLLSNLPNIEYISFETKLGLFNFKGSGRIIGTTPQIFLSKLKLVKIGSAFRGTSREIWFIKLLIKSVSAMDRWTIQFSSNLDQLTTDKLQKLAKDSNCGLVFSNSNGQLGQQE